MVPNLTNDEAEHLKDLLNATIEIELKEMKKAVEYKSTTFIEPERTNEAG